MLAGVLGQGMTMMTMIDSSKKSKIGHLRKSMEWKRTIAKRAMKLWMQGFKPPRKSKPLRFSSGLKAEKKKQLRLQSSRLSISTWLQRRRQSVKEKSSLSQNKEKTADLVEEHEPLRKKAKRAAGSAWTEKHEKHEKN